MEYVDSPGTKIHHDNPKFIVTLTNPQQATLALAGWVTTDPSATNCIPGKGYSVIINTNHVGTAVEWVCPRPVDY